MTRTWPQRITNRLVRIALSAVGGAVLTFGLGKLAQLTGAPCSVLCDPDVGPPLGAVMGVFAFWSVGKE